MIIVFECRVCYQETEDVLTQECLIHGNTYEVHCTHCGKASELHLDIRPADND